MKNIVVKRFRLLLVLFLFALLFGAISLVNHYQFRTYALDLGMFNHALYNFSQGNIPVFTLGADGNEMPFLATHFSWLTAILSPLYWLFGSYTLLLVQLSSILFGGYGAYRYAQLKLGKNTGLPLLILVQFLSTWGIYSALSFDYHSNVVAAMLLPWFLICYEQKKLKKALVILTLILSAKEIMAGWMLFVLLGLLLRDRKSLKASLQFELPSALFCLGYALLVILVLMPWLQGAQNNLQLSRYSHLGSSASEIIATLIQNPKQLILLFFQNTSGEAAYDWIKVETHIMVLFSGGFCLLFRPAYLFMLAPIYLQKMCSNNYGFWGINAQYSIEFIPILSFALTDVLSGLKKHRLTLASGVVASTIIATLVTMDKRVSKWYNAQNTRFYQKEHYDAGLDINQVNACLKLIPEGVSVCASSCLAPHLANRKEIYHFPHLKEAEYVALIIRNRSFYPLNPDSFKAKLEALYQSDKYRVLYRDETLVILKRADLKE